MMMTSFSVAPATPTKAFAMPRKVSGAEKVETKEENGLQATQTTTDANTPPATGKNMVLPVGLGAGATLASGIAGGQGYWEFAPKLIKNETTPVVELTLEQAVEKVRKDPKLKAQAQNEMKEAIAQLAADSQFTSKESIQTSIEEGTLSDDLKNYQALLEEEIGKTEQLIESLKSPFPENTFAISGKVQSKINATNDARQKLLNTSPTDPNYEGLQQEYFKLTGVEFGFQDENTLRNFLMDCPEAPFRYERLTELNLTHNTVNREDLKFVGTMENYRLTQLETLISNDNSLDLNKKQALLDELNQAKNNNNRIDYKSLLWTYQKEVEGNGRLLPIDCDYEALKQIAEGTRPKRIEYFQEQQHEIRAALESTKEFLDSIDTLLKDSPTVTKLVQPSHELHQATQQVDGFMKWGYAKAEELETIGGEALVKHANNAKLALVTGAVLGGLGTGFLACTLINQHKPSANAPSNQKTL